MKSGNLKLQPTGGVQADAKAPEDALASDNTLLEWLNPAGVAGGAPGVNGLMLALQKLFGMLLGGVAVGALGASMFVCLSILLVGYSFFFSLLPA